MIGCVALHCHLFCTHIYPCPSKTKLRIDCEFFLIEGDQLLFRACIVSSVGHENLELDSLDKLPLCRGMAKIKFMKLVRKLNPFSALFGLITTKLTNNLL